MKSKIKKLWVEALRSGEYKKTTKRLRRGDRFCVLGVLCNLHAQAHPEIAATQTTKGWYLGQAASLPYEVKTWAGLKSNNPAVEHGTLMHTKRSLISLNDHTEMTFKQLADIIENSPNL